MGFVAAWVDLPGTRDLLAYDQLILQLARQHGGGGWIAYDSQFRQQAAAGATGPWSELNHSLMAATMFVAGREAPARACPLCCATDHTARDYALAPRLRWGEPHKGQPQGYEHHPARGPIGLRMTYMYVGGLTKAHAPPPNATLRTSVPLAGSRGTVDCKKGHSKGTSTESSSN